MFTFMSSLLLRSPDKMKGLFLEYQNMASFLSAIRVWQMFTLCYDMFIISCCTPSWSFPSATHYVRGTERSTYRPQWRNTMRGTWTRRRSTIENIHNITECQTLIALNVTHVLYTFLVCLRPHTDVKHDTLLLLFCQSLDYFHDSYC